LSTSPSRRLSHRRTADTSRGSVTQQLLADLPGRFHKTQRHPRDERDAFAREVRALLASLEG
jgi:hypothetical protein